MSKLKHVNYKYVIMFIIFLFLVIFILYHSFFYYYNQTDNFEVIDKSKNQ
jgi:hypothetical protein